MCAYLAQGRWFRSIRSNGFFGFDPDAMTLICLPEGSEETMRLTPQGLTKAELMGELAALQALPNYQLSLPFSREAWRQLAYAQNLTGTTL